MYNGLRHLAQAALSLCLLISITLASVANAKGDGSQKNAYYHLIGMGSALGDSTRPFPFPTIVLDEFDTSRYSLRVRFPELGLLGLAEDTVTTPSFYMADSAGRSRLRGYAPHGPLYFLSYPRTTYFIFVDVFSKEGMLLDARPLEYDMDVTPYHSARIGIVHEPEMGLSNQTLRRRFFPDLLPISLEVNPGWSSFETLDSSVTYVMLFRDPSGAAHEGVAGVAEMSLSMKPAFVGLVDSAEWEGFKTKAQIAFGTRGIATSTASDFAVEDSASRSVLRAGFEFVAKTADSSLLYVASILTPRAIVLMMAPLDQPNQQLQFDYLRKIARSMRYEPMTGIRPREVGGATPRVCDGP